MRVALACFGTAGDVHPFLAFARALRAQGDEPVLLLNPAVVDKARREELAFVEVGDRLDIDELIAANPAYMRGVAGTLRVWEDLYVPRIAPEFHAVRQLIEREQVDVVVSHPFAFGSMWAARTASVPNAVAHLSPASWPSLIDPPYNGLLDAPLWFVRAGIRAFYPAVRSRMGRPLRAVCASLGVPYTSRTFDDPRDCDLVFGMWSPRLRPACADDPANSMLCGFPWTGQAERSATLAPDVEEFLNEGAPPIAFGLGSSAVHVAGTFYEDAAAACADVGCRGLLLVANASSRPAELPDGVRAFGWVPYDSALPRCAGFVHHGGAGTTAEGLRAGRPTAIVPFAHDQFDQSHRARRLGVSTTLSLKRLTRARLSEAVRTLLEDEAMRSRAIEVGRAIAAEEDGAIVAARALAERFGLNR